MTSTSEILSLKTPDGRTFGRDLKKEFLFGERHINLNHGSFGTYPRPVREKLRSFQDEAEARPDKFILYDYPKYLDESRKAMSKLLNAPTSELVFVPNATTGINTVLRALSYQSGDHILYFATIYSSCHHTVSYITETTPASSVRVDFTHPVEDNWLISEFKRKVKEVKDGGGRVKVAMFDTVVSVPGVRMPFERLTETCRELGVLSLIDGAHGVGNIELDLAKLKPDFLVSNCHKWLHVARGCAIFHVPLRNQSLIRSTLPTSHGFIPQPVPGAVKLANPLSSSQTPKSPWVTNFEFVGTIDNAPYLCIPTALKWRESIGGEEAIRKYTWTLAQEGSKRVAEILGTELLENSTRTLTRCTMVNVRLPLSVSKIQEVGVKAGVEKDQVGGSVRDWIKTTTKDEYDTFIFAMFYGDQWWVRLSGQVYLEMADFEFAGQTLKDLCARVEKGEWTNVASKL